MKRLFLFVIAILSFGALSLPAQNLYPINLGFEMDLPGDFPTGWYLSGNSATQGYYGMVTQTNPYDGMNTLEFGHGGRFTPGNFGSILQKVDAYNYWGHNIRTSIFLRPELADTNSKIRFFISYFDAEGNALFQETPVVTIPSDGNWHIAYFDSYTDSVAASISFGVILEGVGKVYLDNATIAITDLNPDDYEKPRDLGQWEAEALVNFADIFGSVQYFYPNTHTRKFDWNRLALAGVKSLESVKDSLGESEFLNKFFKAFAPNIRIGFGDQKIEPEPLADPSKTPTLSWYRIGPATRGLTRPFSQEIVNTRQTLRRSEGNIYQFINADQAKGKTIQLSFYYKMLNARLDGCPFVSMKANHPGHTVYQPVNKIIQQFTIGEWQRAVADCFIPVEAESFVVSVGLHGDGEILIDSLIVSFADSKGKTVLMLPNNSSFEDGISLWKINPYAEPEGFNFEKYSDDALEGKSCIRIWTDDDYHTKLPKYGDCFSKKILHGISYSMPLSLQADAEGSLPRPSANLPTFRASNNYLVSSGDRLSRLIITMEMWNLLRNFSITQKPNVDWHKCLSVALSDASQAKNTEEFTNALRRMLAELREDQARVWKAEDNDLISFPFLWEMVGNKLIVTNILNSKECPLQEGDEIISIGSKPIAQLIKEKEAAYMGFSGKYRESVALAEIRNSTNYLSEKFVVSRKGVQLTFDIKRSHKGNFLSTKKLNPIHRLPNDILYLDLTLISEKMLKDSVLSFAQSGSIIFDLRGNSVLNEQILSAFSPEEIGFSFLLPVFYTPDKERMDWKRVPSPIRPLKKSRVKNIAFLVNERTKGNSSLIARTAKSVGLGRFFGTPFETSAGNPTILTMSGAYLFSLTAMLPVIDNEPLSPAENRVFIPDTEVVTSLEAPSSDAQFDAAIEWLKGIK